MRNSRQLCRTLPATLAPQNGRLYNKYKADHRNAIATPIGEHFIRQEDLQEAVKPQPFEPSRIHLSNGATFEVPHPDFVSIGPRTTAILVGESHQIINNLHINYVEPLIATG